MTHSVPTRRSSDLLCLMDCSGITVIDGGIVLRIERDGSAVVQCYGHSCSRDALDRAQRAVLDAHAAFVSQKHDPVALGKIAPRSEERRVGQECVSKSRSRWSPYP